MGTSIIYSKFKKKDQNSTFECEKSSSKDHCKATNPPRA